MNNLTHTTYHFKTLFIILILNFGAISNLHTQQFNSYFQNNIKPSEFGSDSAISTLNNAYKTAVYNNDTTQIINCLISLSRINRILLNYSSAFNNSGEALFLAEDYSIDPKLMAYAHEEFGILNYLFKQDTLAGIHFKKSLEHYKKAYNSNMVSLSDLYQPYYNMLLFYQRIRNDSLNREYIDSCSAIAESTGINNIYNVFLDEKRATILLRENKYMEAYKLLSNSVNILENLNHEASIQHKSFLIIVYATIGNIYRMQNKLDLALLYYEKSIDEEDLFGEHTFYRSFVYSKYASLLYKQGNFQKAYIYSQKSKEINNKYLNPRNKSTHGFLSVKNKYRDALRIKNEEINKKNLELVKNKQKILRFRIFFFIAISLITLISLIIRGRILNLKHRKEKDFIKQQQQHAKDLLEIKNKELTTTTLQLIEKDEVIKTLSSHFEKYNPDSSTRSLLASLENNSTSLWEAFNSRFIALNEDFYERLKVRIPDLSSADLKICALIKLNFSGKEMAHLLGISQGSVHVARHRLRKKIELNRGINLTNFISSI